jgi:hypothetical protein
VTVSASARPHRRLAVFLGTALVVTVAFPAATRAVTVEDKRAEAARLKVQVDAQAERIAAADRKLRLARSDQQDADAQVDAAEARRRAAREVLATARKRMAARAVKAYVHGGQLSVVEQFAGSDGADLNLRRHYIDAALRSDRQAINVLQRTEEDLASSERGLREARQAAQQSVDRVQTNRDVVASNEAVQRANLRRVRGELGELVRQQQQRELAAALRRAERAGAARLALPPPLRAPPVGTFPAPAPAPTTTATSAPPAPLVEPPSPPGGIWACIREKESGNNYRAPGGGAYQFQIPTWQSLGGTGLPEDAAPAVQDAMAIKLQQRSGWSQWTTAAACGAY